METIHEITQQIPHLYKSISAKTFFSSIISFDQLIIMIHSFDYFYSFLKP